MFRSLIEALLSWSVDGFSTAMSKDWRDDPVYKNNLQRLIERNRQFEEAREAKHAARSRHD